jgi:hypothetical protein
MSNTEPASPAPKQEWWCNFCDFKTTDQAIYIQHSCADELKKQGKEPKAGNKNQCG